MSTLQDRQPAQITTLACLIARLDADPALAEAPRREMKSAINTIAKVLKAPPHLVPAAPDQLRRQLNLALPVAARVQSARFTNAKSLLRRALALYDPKVMPARSRAGLLPEWSALLKQPRASPVALQRGLARFSRYCSAAGIRPCDVTQAVYDGFYDDLVAHCLIRSPRETQQTAGHAWNAAAGVVPGWPQTVLAIANHRRNPSLPWSAFPDSLLQDVDAYLAPRSAKTFKFSRGVPALEESTIASKRALLRQFVSCLVESGRDPATFRSLADVVTLEAADEGLAILNARAGGQNTGRIYNTAYMLYGIAEHWLQLDPATVTEFRNGCREIRPLGDGMTRKNKLWLKQFDDPHKLMALLNLPLVMMAEACGPAVPTKAEARIAQLAVAIELLLRVPLRISNVAALELGRTLILEGSTNGHIIIDFTEVKNDVDIDAPLSRSFLRLLDTYLKRFHGLLAPPGCAMIFPSADGGHKRSVVLATQIKACVAERCGIALSAHLFRHLAAKLYLEARQGEYGSVRLLLGHKSIDTTTRAYCGTEKVQAFHSQDDHISQLRAGGVLGRAQPPLPPALQRRGRRR